MELSKTVLIAFEPAEIPALASFASRLGKPFGILLLQGTAEWSYGSESIQEAALTEVPPADALDNALMPSLVEASAVVLVSTMRSKDLAPRLAARLDAAMVTDVVTVLSPNTFQRPVVAGSLIATVEVEAPTTVFTVRPAGFPAPEPGQIANRTTLELSICGPTRRLSESAKSGGRPDLTQAKVIVSGGRPLRDAETFERVVGGLADALGGAVGATRAAVDSGIASNELQIGQTGKVVAPDLYIAAGISGSTQHLAGIKDSKVIVAINKDPDAPIHQVADFSLVADLFDALPDLERAARDGKP